ncbi:endonuclease/exonuclease/phosphatase family protein [Herbidospora cretacea]|uniref:endonuclease/exonuclease/phosphatase family protein n=1 Tax=Herbidospora cretacea TaxID=28444 RepID=UPI0007C69E0E|nr:endonuclease/exonuclease/phosphatase family protein [Herbidospora cretacea]
MRPVAAVTLGLLLFMDAVRVLFPSLITIYGQAGDTPPEQLGLFAALWFVLPLAALLIPAKWALLGGAGVLALGRLALQATDGGLPQLYVSAVSVTAGIVFLYGAARLVARPHARPALPLGLALSQALHLSIGHLDLVWRDGLLPWIPTVLVAVAFAWAVLGVTAAADPAPARLWFALGPAILLAGMYLGPSALIGQGTTPGDRLWPTLALLAALAVLALAGTAGHPAQLAPILMIVGVWIAHDDGHLRAATLPIFALGLGWCLRVAGDGPPGRRPGGALLAGMIVFFVGTFVYYAAYDLVLGFDNAYVPLALGLVVAATAVRLPDLPQVLPAVAAGLAVLALWALPQPRATEGPGVAVDRDEFTLIAYNIRMGFGTSGTLDLDEIADWAASKKPDVVLLSEVDRGWFLNGGHDDLDRIATRLGMHFHFAPAADELWGDAVLTNLPIRNIQSAPLVTEGYPTGAQAQTVVVEVGGAPVGIVNTHLQEPELQSATLHGVMPPAPALVAGDLNLTPGDPAFQRLLAEIGLTDPLKDLGDPPTSPADDPVKRIDHVLLTEGLTAVSAEVPRVPFSDHLPVVMRIRVG